MPILQLDLTVTGFEVGEVDALIADLDEAANYASKVFSIYQSLVQYSELIWRLALKAAERAAVIGC